MSRKKQPFGNKAKQFVSNLIFGKMVKIISKGKTDRYKRLIATIETLEGRNINKSLVTNGLSFYFKNIQKDNSYNKLEKEARKNKIGFWWQPNPITPSEFRKSRRKR